ncbi:MAG: PPC domain-containing protein [Pirellulales bacterium]
MKHVRCICAIVLSSSLLFNLNASAAEPVISRFNPPGFQRGTEVELEILGARLADAKKLLFFESGFEVLSVTAEADNKVKAKIKIADTCSPGLHAMRLASASGISNLRYLGVSALPQIAEKEPNSDFATPQAIEFNHTINGVVQNEDVDYYSVELKENQQITVELEGLRLGTEFFDPFVAVLDENRFEVARSDDAPLLQQDCVCSVTVPKAGKYIIEVRESSFGGNDNCQYRLHVGDFPRPLAVVPAGGRPGETIQATMVDSSGKAWTEAITLPSEVKEEFPYFSTQDGKLAPSPNLLRVVDMPNAMEQEPDNDPNALAVHDLPVALNGVLQASGDIDKFRIRAKKDQQIEIVVFGRRVLRSPIDSFVEITNMAGGRLAANDDSGGPDSLQAFKIPADGEYIIAVRDHLNEGSPQHAYRIEVSAPRPSLHLEIAELERYQATMLEVPRGARMAVMLTAQRKNFGSDLTLSMEGAPVGLEIVNPAIPQALGQIPMMIRAAADAPVDSALANLKAVTTGNDLNLNGKLKQRTMLVRGQNNVDMWGHTADRMSIAVCEELPYDIVVEQPKVPLVRNGQMAFKVKVIRKSEYKDPIRLRALYAPGGVSVNQSISIPPDKDEVEVPVTANGNAQIGVFPMTFLARSKVKGGDIQIASEFVNLEIVDSFFDFKFNKTSAEIGKDAVVGVELKIKRPFEGEAAIELLGLPAGVTLVQPSVKVTPDMTALSYPIQVTAEAKAGQFKTLVCRAVITKPEGTIMQNQGTGEIQLDQPVVVPQPVAAAAPPPPPAQPAAPTAKPLSRLEQLRQSKMQAQPAASGNSGSGN